jgi:hypothetical protein
VEYRGSVPSYQPRGYLRRLRIVRPSTLLLLPSPFPSFLLFFIPQL